jgi:hypothetical protein
MATTPIGRRKRLVGDLSRAACCLHRGQVDRRNMPLGTIVQSTLASSAISTVTAAITPAMLLVPPGLLVVGTNVVAVEVGKLPQHVQKWFHCSPAATIDVGFGISGISVISVGCSVMAWVGAGPSSPSHLGGSRV